MLEGAIGPSLAFRHGRIFPGAIPLLFVDQPQRLHQQTRRRARNRLAGGLRIEVNLEIPLRPAHRLKNSLFTFDIAEPRILALPRPESHYARDVTVPNRKLARLLPHLERLHEVQHAHFLEPPLNHAGPDRPILQLLQAQAVDDFLRTPDQILQEERLGDEFFDAFDDGPQLLLDVATARQKNEGNLLRLRANAQLLVKLAPVEPRHAVVAKNKIGRIVHDFQQGVSAVRSCLRLAMRRQPFHQQVEDQRIIVDHQHTNVVHWRHYLPRFPARARFERAESRSQRGRRYSPLCPPDFRSRYSSVISMPRSSALHIS